ncbi:CACNA1F [Symbiodinium natans]|uniref:CACNA1F protein n=1 Tax=Symbiodinium natans TaxID=878477 RepID=A0A812TWN1_9DINO|nr:CACNA1F [Symbiodinium natans]
MAALSRAEGEARFHRLLVQLVAEFEVLRGAPIEEHPALEAEMTETRLSPADAEPSAGLPRASPGRQLPCKVAEPAEAQEPQKAHEEESLALETLDASVGEESLEHVPLVPAPVFDLPEVLRKFYLLYADTTSGQLTWERLCEVVKKGQGSCELDLLEADVRAMLKMVPEDPELLLPPPQPMRMSTTSAAPKELQVSFPGFAQLMCGDISHFKEAAQERMKGFRFLVQEEAEVPKLRPQLAQASSSWFENIPLDYKTFLLEVAPAFVILANAVVIGISADDHPDAPGWQVLELMFTLIFTFEALLRMRWTGCRVYLTGPDAGWNYFDMLCLTCAYTDLIITGIVQATAEGEGPALSAIMLIKILRLARVCRIIRVMRFGAVRELRVIILGVLSGVRVLFWAIVLLFFTVYIIGVSARLLISDEPEFATVSASMLTIFRCVTDGCTDLAGQPLQEHLRIKHGSAFMLVYMVLFLFVVIGIFNLIMAVFLDSVVSDHATRELQELGYKYEEMQEQISNVIATLASGRRVEKKDQSKTFCSWICSFFVRRPTHLKKSMRLNVHKEMNKEVAVTREAFTRWLEYPEMQELLTFCKIETATKYDLFDVLDADLGGQLHFSELVEGLMQLRGPITKCDVISLRLMMSNLLRSVIRVLDLAHALPGVPARERVQRPPSTVV